MQNLPIITATQPVTPAQAPGQVDNSAQAAEPFGSVLARQRANTDKPKSSADNRDKNQQSSTSPSSSSTDGASAATGNELETPATSVVNVLPGDMLAALLPATANIVVTSKKPVSQAPLPEGTSTLPSDMLAALLSTPLPMQPDASAHTQQPIAITVEVQGGVPQQPITVGVQGDILQQPVAVGVQGGLAQQPIALGMQGDTRQQVIAAGVRNSAQQSVSAGLSIGEPATSSPLRAQGAPVADASAAQGKTFSSVLEALGKDAANTAPSASATQISTQAALPDATLLAGITQGAPSPVAASPNGPAQAVVNTPVTHAAWGNEFNQKITWLATQHEQTAELHLNPPHLGPIDVVLNISGDQATALFTSPHAAVRDAMEQALPKLREMLADNGIMLGNATVNDQSPKEQQAWQADKQRNGNTGLPGNADDTIPVSTTVWPTRRHQGMVDTFA